MLNEVIHSQTRLRIMTVLFELGRGSDMSFTRLQDILGMTPGNLSAHLKRLEQEGYLSVVRTFTQRGVPNTHIGITEEGKDAFTEYIKQLRVLMGSALSGKP